MSRANNALAFSSGLASSDAARMTIGSHVLVNIKNITDKEKLKFYNNIKPLFLEVIHKFKLNVANYCHKQFTPHGVTLLYLLTTSHLSCHTFVEEGVIAMDLFTCDKSQVPDPDELKRIIYNFFDHDIKIEMDLIER